MNTNVAPAVGTASVLVGTESDDEVGVLEGCAAGTVSAVGVVVGRWERYRLSGEQPGVLRAQ